MVLCRVVMLCGSVILSSDAVWRGVCGHCTGSDAVWSGRATCKVVMFCGRVMMCTVTLRLRDWGDLTLVA